MTSNRNQMLELAIALNGEIPKEGHRCSVSPPLTFVSMTTTRGIRRMPQEA